jgi:hypothetical protein
MNNVNFQEEYSHLPFNIILYEKTIPESKIKPEESPNFIIKKNNEVKFVFVNGFLIDIDKTEDWSGNSIIYRK